MQLTQIKGHLSLLGANICWGVMAPVAKLVLTAGIVTPLILTEFRIVGAAILFWILSLLTPREKVPPADVARLAGAGMLGILFNQGCYIFGVGLTAPSEASIITTTMPMWVMVLARIILGNPITAFKALGIAIGGAGAVMLVFSSAQGARGSNPMLGDLLVLTAQLSYALYLTLYKNFLRRYSLVTMMKYMFTFAAIVILPFNFGSLRTTDWAALTPTLWGGIAYVVVMATFVAYILMMTGQKILAPTVVGIYNYFQPIVAMCVGLWLGLDSFTTTKAMAMALIFTGVYLVTTGTTPSRRH